MCFLYEHNFGLFIFKTGLKNNPSNQIIYQAFILWANLFKSREVKILKVLLV